MSRNNNVVPLVRRDFNRAVDRRCEERQEEPACELYFRDASVGDKVGTRLFGKIDDKN